jgi:hypothetical protein
MKSLQQIKEEREAIAKNYHQGLVIRYWSTGAYALCDGKCPEGVTKEDGEIYTGTVVSWFNTWEEADNMRKIIDQAYGI